MYMHLRILLDRIIIPFSLNFAIMIIHLTKWKSQNVCYDVVKGINYYGKLVASSVDLSIVLLEVLFEEPCTAISKTAFCPCVC